MRPLHIALAGTGAVGTGVLASLGAFAVGLNIILGRRKPTEVHPCGCCNGTGDEYIAGYPHACRLCFGVGLRVTVLDAKASGVRSIAKRESARRIWRGTRRRTHASS